MKSKKEIERRIKQAKRYSVKFRCEMNPWSYDHAQGMARALEWVLSDTKKGKK